MKKLNKKAIIGIVGLVAFCAIGVARLLGYDVAPVCAVAPSLCAPPSVSVDSPVDPFVPEPTLDAGDAG